MVVKNTRATVWWGAIALLTLLIWGQSLLGQELSNKQSGAVHGLLGNLLGEWIYDTFLFQNIRKVAHFAEFAALGMAWAGCRLRVRGTRRPPLWLAVAAGPLTAMCDELWQFVSVRAPRLTDVMLDCAGYACGFGVIVGIWWLCRRLRKRK